MAALPLDDPRHLGDPGTPDFELVRYPFCLLNRTVSRYNIVIERCLRPIGVDIPTWRVLMILGEETPASIGRIAERAVINVSTMTRILQRMTDAGLVAGRPRADDSRVTEIELTTAGDETLAASRTAVAPVYAALIAGFTRRQFETLIARLDQLHANLGEL